MKQFYRKHPVIFWLAVASLIFSAWLAALAWDGEASVWAELALILVAVPLYLFVPLGVYLLLACGVLAALWISLRDLRPFVRLGACLLAAGWICAVLLPAIGSIQLPISNVVFSASASDADFYHPRIDEQILYVECALLPGGGLQPGITASIHNRGTVTLSYRVGLTANRNLSGDTISVTIAPGETQRIVWPLGALLTRSLVYVEAVGGPADQFIDHCGAINGSRQALIVLGMLLVLAGAVCLGVGWYRGRQA